MLLNTFLKYDSLHLKQNQWLGYIQGNIAILFVAGAPECFEKW